MRKKPLKKRIKAWFIRKVINPIRYRNTRWCFDGGKCDNNCNCVTCNYYIDL